MPTRKFTVHELADLGVPPDSPKDIKYSETVLVDEHVSMSKYSQVRRCVFRDDDGRTYGVTYEAQVEAGHYEVGPPPENHGWLGATVEAVEVEQRPVIVARWEPVGDEPAVDRPARGAIDSLAAVWFQEAGAREDVARESAAAWIIQHADEVAELYDAYLDSAEGEQ
ncbi:hypothetical protein [Streptomyces sp. ITFR-6]|uniref:hypothetical protein n=1 Tax=Streptomyces sp. ITFR-6 TaxID=3075197 RepID=UPI002889CB9C|nr:hypothetical protein [Streptomyces sp. ITFR-6]WNI31469.1 hypothetical protein RLT59_23770 [Streptomyces sp. ITFR-6]